MVPSPNLAKNKGSRRKLPLLFRTRLKGLSTAPFANRTESEQQPTSEHSKARGFRDGGLSRIRNMANKVFGVGAWFRVERATYIKDNIAQG